MKKRILRYAFRNFASHPFISLLHLFGLAIGVTCFTIGALYVANELSFDSFHADANNIYRVYEWLEGLDNGPARGDASLSLPLGSALQRDFPDVEACTRIQSSPEQYPLRIQGVNFLSPVTVVDDNFFQFFSFTLLKGSPETVLKDPGSAVLDEETSRKIFGTVDVLGKSIQIKIDGKFRPFIVSGVSKLVPSNSSIHFSILTNFAAFESTQFGRLAVGNWRVSGFQTFIRIRPGARVKFNEKAMFNFRKQYLPYEEKELVDGRLWDSSKPYPITFRLQPLKSIHTSATIAASGESGINLQTVWITLIVCFIILIVACVNYTTLTISLSAQRTKEITLKKILGSSKRRIFQQIIIESLLNSTIAAVFALCFTAILLPTFNDITGSKLTLSSNQLRFVIWLFPIIILVTNAFSGLYPAWMFSKFKPIEFVSQTAQKSKPKMFIEMLTVFQFAVSIFFSITTLIVMNQMYFVRSKDLGFDRKNVLVAHLDNSSNTETFESYKTSLLESGDIASVSTSNVEMGEGLNESGFSYKGNTVHFSKVSVGNDFFATLGISLIAGREFSKSFPNDTATSIVVNEQLVRALGLTIGQALGLQLQGISNNPENGTKTIVGVVKDFNFASLKKRLNPVVIFPTPEASPGGIIYIKIRPGHLDRTLTFVRQKWSRFYPENQFDYRFLDEDFDSLYRSDQKTQKALTWAGLAALLLSFLGLFGLASISTVGRIREIAIRNVLGASALNNILLLSKRFVLLVAIGWITAVPVAIYYNYSWLQNFVYRINLTWQPFLIVGIVFSAVAFFVVSFYTIQTALANPSKILRRS